MDKYLRFQVLKAAGVVRNRMTLSRWIRSQGFPAGVLLGPNTRAWRADDIERWLAERTQNSTEEYVTDRSPGGGMPVRASTAPDERHLPTDDGVAA